jgi:hypothetical protein
MKFSRYKSFSISIVHNMYFWRASSFDEPLFKTSEFFYASQSSWLNIFSFDD